MNFVPYAIPFFIAAIALEFAWARRSGRHVYRLNDTLNSLQLGTLSRLQGIIQLGLGALAYDALIGPGLFQWPAGHWSTWVFAFVAYDLCYYFAHRFGHEWRILWASHVAHHQSEEFNLSTALRQTSTGFATFIFYVPLYVLGLPAAVIISVGSLNLIYQFWVHTEHVRRLGVLEWLLVTPSNHRVHHAKNPEYLDRNYGGVFILWDRLFGTFRDEDPELPCVYGITRQLGSWNPLWANVHVFVEGWQDMRRTPRWRDKLTLWFRGPGWRPPGAVLPDYDWQAPKFDPPTGPFTRAYTFAQFWIAVALSFVVLAADADRSLQLWCAALLAFSFYVQGTWLESRPYARRLEWLRLLLVALTALAAGPVWGGTTTGLLLGYAGLSALCLNAGRDPAPAAIATDPESAVSAQR